MPMAVTTIIHGSDGNDIFQGGNGDDNISGGDGNDSLDGGDGADELGGNGGDDTQMTMRLAIFVTLSLAKSRILNGTSHYQTSN